MNPASRNRLRARSQSGFSLIELMIALLLGLLVSAAAIGMFISNARTHRTTESLSRVQESARIAFELMARDLREGSGNPCSNELQVTNRVTNYTTNWWSNWDRAAVSRGVIGYENGALPGTLAGTDAVEVIGASGAGVLVSNHTLGSNTLRVNNAAHGFVTNDLLMVCDNRLVSIFPATVSGVDIVHPANLGINGTAFTYTDNAMVSRLMASRWFVAANGRGGNSLFRTSLRTGAAVQEEVVEGVQDMEILYLLPGANAYQPANNAAVAARWPEVQAVLVRISLVGAEADGTDGQALRRQLEHVVTLRNRNA
ncbi:prepilin-type N-terminal cleavage/methylation domain-containing protein [Arenimonas sp. MALMAid1274]|uniref:prepilin-type N-terminal cleavage/methylation domain-containing protein n=1 Tax=Arenimonas sp. MALMAid1274 TaxID=3411630 RepID=UPI003BA1E7B9